MSRIATRFDWEPDNVVFDDEDGFDDEVVTPATKTVRRVVKTLIRDENNQIVGVEEVVHLDEVLE